MSSAQSTGMGTNGQERDQNKPNTKNVIPNSGLKPAQRRAVERLAGGGRIADAARDAGVHRNTVRRWLGQAAFLRELQAVDGQMRQVARSRVFAMADSAANAIEYAIAKGDARLALQLLKSIDVFGYDRIRPSEATRAGLDLFARLDAEGVDEDDDSDARGEKDELDRINRINTIDGNGTERWEDGMDGIERIDGDGMEREDGFDEIDGKNGNGSESVAGDRLTETEDFATDDPDRYRSPIFGNLGPDGHGRHTVKMSVAPAGAIGNEPAAAIPSVGFALRCVLAWFSMHYSALFCTMRLFFAGVLCSSPGGAKSDSLGRKEQSNLPRFSAVGAKLGSIVFVTHGNWSKKSLVTFWPT